MKTRNARAVIVIALLSFVWGACGPKSGPEPGPRLSGESGKKYTLKFHRPLQVGDRYRLVASGTKTASMEINGRLVASETSELEYAFESIVTVQAVNSRGDSTREKHQVISSAFIKKGTSQTPLAKGAIVLAEAKGGKEVFSAAGKPVAKDVAAFLGEVLSMRTDDIDVTEDDIMGPGEAKGPGDEWPIRGTKLLKRMGNLFKTGAIRPKLSDVSGTVRFLRLGKRNGQQGAHFRMKTSINNVCPSLDELKPKSGSLSIDMQGWVPLDPKLKIGTEKAKMRMTFTGTMVKDGATFEITSTVQGTIRREIRRLR